MKVIINNGHEPGNDCGYQELIVDGKKVLKGDYYHDRIEDKIEGFISCLNFLEIKFEIEINDIQCPHCEEKLSKSCCGNCQNVNNDNDGLWCPHKKNITQKTICEKHISV